MNHYCNITEKMRFSELIPEKVILSYHIGVKKTEQVKKDLLQILAPSPTGQTISRFNFCFDLRSREAESLTLDLISSNRSLFLQTIFHHRYFNKSGVPVIFFISNNHSTIEGELSNNVRSLLTQQGYHEVEIVDIREYSSEGSAVDTNFLLPTLNNDLITHAAGIYRGLLKDSFYCGKYVCFELTDHSLLPRLVKKLDDEEKGLMSEVPDQYRRMVEIFQGIKKMDSLSSELVIVRNELENYKVYLEIIRGQDQANKLKQFYHYEYEILPLWYKKLGHIIKVMMGRRTFRSLFADNVKKYKE